MEYNGMDWIQLAHGEVQWLAYFNAEKNFRFP